MQINTVMSLNRGGARAALPNRPSAISLTKLSKEEIHKHGKLVEYRHRVRMLSADLESAVQALSAANEDIAALRKELAATVKNRDALVKQLENELKDAKDRLSAYKSNGAEMPVAQGISAKAGKSKRQKKTEAVAEPLAEPSQPQG